MADAMSRKSVGSAARHVTRAFSRGDSPSFLWQLVLPWRIQVHPQMVQQLCRFFPIYLAMGLEYEDDFRELRGSKEEYQRTRNPKKFRAGNYDFFFLFLWMILRAVRLQHTASRFRRWHVS